MQTVGAPFWLGGEGVEINTKSFKEAVGVFFLRNSKLLLCYIGYCTITKRPASQPLFEKREAITFIFSKVEGKMRYNSSLLVLQVGTSWELNVFGVPSLYCQTGQLEIKMCGSGSKSRQGQG